MKRRRKRTKTRAKNFYLKNYERNQKKPIKNKP